MDVTTAAPPNIDPKFGLPVSEAPAGMGIAVTKVASGGMPVTFVVPPP